MDGILITEEDVWDGDAEGDHLWDNPDSLVTRSCLNELLEWFSSESYKTSNHERKVEYICSLLQYILHPLLVLIDKVPQHNSLDDRFDRQITDM